MLFLYKYYVVLILVYFSVYAQKLRYIKGDV